MLASDVMMVHRSDVIISLMMTLLHLVQVASWLLSNKAQSPARSSSSSNSDSGGTAALGVWQAKFWRQRMGSG